MHFKVRFAVCRIAVNIRTEVGYSFIQGIASSAYLFVS